MKNSAITQGLLGDELIDVVDDIRREIRRELGTRPFRVLVVTRRWSGGRVGQGGFQDTILELDPPPMVELTGGEDRMGFAGREESGGATLTEVSLRYSEEELSPPSDPLAEFFYVVVDSHGQKQRDRYFVLASDPQPRRGDQVSDRTDWKVQLRRTSAPETGVDAP